MSGVREPESGGDGERLEGAFLDPAVAAVTADVPDRDRGLGQGREPGQQRALVGLDRDEQVRAAGVQVTGMPGLGVQRVGGDNHVVEGADRVGDPVEDRREQGDLVGLGADLDLGEDDPSRGVIAGQQMHPTAVAAARPAQRLAIHGHHPPRPETARPRHPATMPGVAVAVAAVQPPGQTRRDRVGVDAGEDPPQPRGDRDRAGKPHPAPAGLIEVGQPVRDRRERPRPCQHRAHRHR